MATSKRFNLAIAYEDVEAGRIQAMVPAVPGTVSVGRSRTEARDNVLDALQEMLAAPIASPARGSIELLRARLDVHTHELEREL